MAITADKGIEAILKTWYKEGVSNLLIPRNDPALKEIGFTKVEGKEQRFATLYSRGGAVSADFLVAKNKAARTAKNAEFIVTPGRLFSSYIFNAAEVQSSLSKRGAYMKIAGNKFFAANQAFRSTLAASEYGSGFGEIGIYTSDGTAFVANTEVELTGISNDATAKIDIDSSIVLKQTRTGAELVELVVTEIDESNKKIKVIPQAAYTPTAGKYILALKGSMDGAVAGGLSPAANPVLPMGFGAWLPIVGARQGTDWENYISTSFYGVNRSVAPDRLAGQFYNGSADTKIADAITNLFRKTRRAGGVPDLVILNELDYYNLTKEVGAANTLWTNTDSKNKKKATLGFSDFGVAVSTSWINSVYDSPYCPEGVFYIIDKSAVEYFVYTNADVVKDGITENNPGKQDVLDADNKGHEDEPFKLLIDDVLSVVPGEPTSEGESVRASINFLGTMAVTNPSVCGVGILPGYDVENLVGYYA